MKKIRDIIRLKETTDMGERKIAGALNVARTVVARYLNDFYKSGFCYSWEKPIDICGSKHESAVRGLDTFE